EEGMTILQAAQKAGVHIPTLCYHPDLKTEGVCRVCSVEVKGQNLLAAACGYPVIEGMEVETHSPKVREARRLIVELLLANHPQDCLTCSNNQKCELQDLAREVGIERVRFNGERRELPIDTSPAIIRNMEKCILCKRCVRVCQELQAVGALFPTQRGWDTTISPAFDKPLQEVVCAYCGQCINRCPTGALKANDPAAEVWAAMDDPEKHVVVQTAPAVRAAIGEEFGMPAGSLVTGQMVTALRMLGFDKVFDTDFTADLTIMEEGSELLQRLKTGGVLPMITSCSPGWIKFIEHFYPDQLEHLSSCKSPQQMFGALAKTYYAEKAGIDPSKIVVVSIMPCSAKKFECERPEMASSGYQDVDYVLTTREVAGMMKEAGIDLSQVSPGEFDLPLGMSTGAGVIFGATGGVMEAALRTVYEVVTGKKLDNVDIAAVRGMDGVREAEIDVDGTKVRAAVAHGLANAKKLLDLVREGKADYHFIEVMCCPGGCIGGGGQPFPTSEDIRKKRAEALYLQDRELPLRKSHENPVVTQLYEEFLGQPLGHKSHELLHTRYTPRSNKVAEKSVKVEVE
ncbi:MAG TPA: NADH-dependent [FeFe] hydrogenase, group A6, partial [Armatimonadota bacterium]